MLMPDAHDYELTLWLFERGLAFVNFLALWSFYIQMEGLTLSGGLLPASDTMKRLMQKAISRTTPPYANVSPNRSSVFTWMKRIYAYPTLFWISSSDEFVRGVTIFGILCSILSFFNYYTVLCNTLSTICYLSLHYIGQPWLGLQMHATVIETNFAYVLSYLAFGKQHLWAVVFTLRFLAWRIMLGCGACKYGSGDPTWRSLTAMNYHYYTQPLPNPLSWYFHKLPDWHHKMTVIGTHLVEGPLTFLTWGNWWMRLIAFIAFSGLNLFINISGNYGFLGILTIVQSICVLDDATIHWILNFTGKVAVEDTGTIEDMDIHFNRQYHFDITGENSWESYFRVLVGCAIVAPYILASFVPLVDTFHNQIPFLDEFFDYLESSPKWKPAVLNVKLTLFRTVSRITNSRMFQAIWMPFWENILTNIYIGAHPFRCINRYAKFGTMTTKRREIIIEGSQDGQNWKEYKFKCKADDVCKSPAWVPFHLPGKNVDVGEKLTYPGLDWQIWFLPSRLNLSRADWYWIFVDALLEGKPAVLKLLKEVPFEKPRYIRTSIYDYKFNYDPERPKEWWNRKLVHVVGIRERREKNM